MKLLFFTFSVFITFSIHATIIVEAIPEGLESGYTTYKIFVDKRKNNLESEAIIRDLDINLSELPNLIPAEKLLSRYIQKWIYKTSKAAGQNCWHTSISSLFNDWAQERRMPAKEFACHLEHSFKKISAPKEWGDLIRIRDGAREIHGFTFVGVDSKDPKRILTLTKNGYSIGRFVFMSLDDVKQMWGDEVSFYRAIKHAEDPRNDKNAPCSGFDEWEQNLFDLQ